MAVVVYVGSGVAHQVETLNGPVQVPEGVGVTVVEVLVTEVALVVTGVVCFGVSTIYLY